MDVRHVSSEKVLLNLLIQKINQQLRAGATFLNANLTYQNKLKKITKTIYHYCNMQVDIESYFSLKNLATTDRVLLPEISVDVPPDPKAFQKMLLKLKKIPNVANKNSVLQKREENFNCKLSQILAKNHRVLCLNKYASILMDYGQALNAYVVANANTILKNKNGCRDAVERLTSVLYAHLEKLQQFISQSVLRSLNNDLDCPNLYKVLSPLLDEMRKCLDELQSSKRMLKHGE